MKYKKLIMWMVFCILSLGMLSGCGQVEDESVVVVYQYGDATITYGEFYVYAKTIQEDYQKTYGEGIWSLELTTDNGAMSMKDVTLEDIISDINRVKVLVAQAEELEVSVEEEEKVAAKEQAKAFYKGLTKKDIEETQVTEELVEKIIEENMIAEKVYQKMIADCDFEISEEEARMITFYDIVFECYEAKKDGTVEEFSEEKKETQLAKANEALADLAQEEDMTYESIVDTYNLQYSASYTMSKTEIVEEYGESVADKILALTDGEVSTVIPSEYGYHIFKMLKAKDEDLTKKNKDSIVDKMQREYFNETYEKWAKKYESHFSIDSVDRSLLEKFPFGEE